jgi:hypothetical protein
MERKISSQTAVEITILRSKKERRYYSGTGEEFTDTISTKKREVVGHDKRKSQKNLNLILHGKSNAKRPI